MTDDRARRPWGVWWTTEDGRSGWCTNRRGDPITYQQRANAERCAEVYGDVSIWRDYGYRYRARKLAEEAKP